MTFIFTRWSGQTVSESRKVRVLRVLNGILNNSRDFLNYTAYIQFSVDNQVLHTVTPPPGGFFELGQFPGDIPNPWENGRNPRMAPFDEEFHFILNVAVGGNFFPDNSTPPRPWGASQQYLDFWEAREFWNTTWVGDDGALQVDYIRVWAV